MAFLHSPSKRRVARPRPLRALAVIGVSLGFAPLLGLAGLVAPLGAQQSSPGLTLRADSLYFAGHPEEALAFMEGAPEGLTPPERRWRALRSLVALALVAPSLEGHNHHLDRAIRLAGERPPDPPLTLDEKYWTAAAEGLRSLNAGPRYASELGVRTRTRAQEILEEDRFHGGAHNVLGRVEEEFLRLSRPERLLARLLLGRGFPSEATWGSAEHHLREATRLWPHMVLFHLDLARFLERRGRNGEARTAAERALVTAPLHPPDSLLKDEARALLERLDRL